MDACTIEVGLLRKHACGQPSVAHCQNCEQPLCSKHAVAQLSPSGARTGKFMCAQCHEAAKAYAKTEAAAAAQKTAGRAPPAPHKPAAAPAPKAATPQNKPEPPVENSAPLEFTPEPKKPADKK